MIKSSVQPALRRSGQPGGAVPRTRRGRPRGTATATRERIIAAALAALGERGYAATTARVIADRGGFPVGLIFYHFRTLDDLLLAVLDHTTAERLPRWRAELSDVDDVATLLERMRALYDEDVASAHALAVKELVAGGGFSERLAPELAERMEPWFALAEDAVARVLAGSPVLSVLPARDIASTAVALYLGLETVARLRGEQTSAAALFAAGARYGPLLSALHRQDRAPAERPTRLDVE